MTNIQQNIFDINNKIREYEARYNRQPNSVALLASSKKQTIEDIREAIRAGQTVFGENYLQEALEKMGALADENLEWHFIGSIQSNKTKKIAEHFSWVDSVSNIHIAKRLNDQRPLHLPPLNICIELNISGETTKSGTTFDEILPLAAFCLTQPRLKLRGLMAIPARKYSFVDQRAELHKLRTIYDMLGKSGYNLDILSMGMSDDLEAAIAEGATVVRIGTAIFGPRI